VHITHATSAQLKHALVIGHGHVGSDSRGRLEGFGVWCRHTGVVTESQGVFV